MEIIFNCLLDRIRKCAIYLSVIYLLAYISCAYQKNEFAYEVLTIDATTMISPNEVLGDIMVLASPPRPCPRPCPRPA